MKNSNLSYNFEPFEGKKEVIYTENNSNLYSKNKINSVIHDLKIKGDNNYQNKDIMISMNNIDLKLNLKNKYIPVNNTFKIINIQTRIKNKDINLYTNGANNKIKIVRYYNNKSHLLNKISNRKINNKIIKDNSNSKIINSHNKIGNSYLSYNIKKNNYKNNIINNEDNIKKRKDMKILYKKGIINEKNENKENINPLNKFNSLYNLKELKEIKNNGHINNSNIKSEIKDSRKHYKINFDKDKSTICFSSFNLINKKYQSSNSKKNIKYFEDNFCKKDKEIIKLNSSQILKRQTLNIENSNLSLKTKLLENNDNTLNFKTINESFGYYDDFNKKYLNLNNKSLNIEKYLHKNLNNRMNDKYNNHSFYNSSYSNLKETKNQKIFNINSNKTKKVNRIYHFFNKNFDKKEKCYLKTNSFNNYSKKRVIIRNSNNCEKKLKKIFNQMENRSNFNKSQNIENIYNNEKSIESRRNYSDIKKYKLEIPNKRSLKYSPHNIYEKIIKKEYHDGIYEGIIINNKREIKGIMYYKNGSKYEGEYKNDKKQGKGIFTSQNYNNPNLIGIKYEGEFNNDKIEGYGIGTYTSGDKYEGEWKDNKQYGRGTLIYKGGGKYIGEWKNGKLNGNGIYYLKNGERFEGNFLDDKYNGYGKYFYNDGEFLEGIFKNDLPIGKCILHKINGVCEERDFN